MSIVGIGTISAHPLIGDLRVLITTLDSFCWHAAICSVVAKFPLHFKQHRECWQKAGKSWRQAWNETLTGAEAKMNNRVHH